MLVHRLGKLQQTLSSRKAHNMWARDAIQPAIYVFLALNFVCVGLRVYVRTVVSKAFGYDDYAMILAYVRLSMPAHEYGGQTFHKYKRADERYQAGYVALCACTMVSVSNGYADDQPNPKYDMITAVKVSGHRFKILVASELELMVFCFAVLRYIHHRIRHTRLRRQSQRGPRPIPAREQHQHRHPPGPRSIHGRHAHLDHRDQRHGRAPVPAVVSCLGRRKGDLLEPHGAGECGICHLRHGCFFEYPLRC